MTRTLLAACLFAAAAFACLATGTSAQQPPAKKQPKGKFDPPAAKKPDDATLKLIREKTEQLRKAVDGLKAKKLRDDVLIEVEIYLKAAENIVRFEEWYHANSGKWALTTLDQGLERAKQAADGNAPWRDAAGKWVLRAYRSGIDESIQPYAVLLPHDYGKDPKKKWRLDIVLHGRDSSLTEAKFIATHNGTAPKDLGYVQLEPYGRGNNAYRWAGENDVWTARVIFQLDESRRLGDDSIDTGRRVLRGFSMGGAGTWHIGLHHPFLYSVIGPGAGFTTTHGYVSGLPAKLPDYQEKCLRIYDAVDYAENAFNVPIVAYSGEKDQQKAAADNIEKRLKGFKESVQFTHLVAPGLMHQMPKEWQEKAETEYRKYADKGRLLPERGRFVTYTPQYGSFGIGVIDALERQYERALVDYTDMENAIKMTTDNVRRLVFFPRGESMDATIDGQEFKDLKRSEKLTHWIAFEKRNGRWVRADLPVSGPPVGPPIKRYGLCGPIDHAFMSRFQVGGPTTPDPNSIADRYATASLDQFAKVWDRYFRGILPKGDLEPVKSPSLGTDFHPNWVLFGSPWSNPHIAKVLPKLPITWTKDKLVVNGVEYDPKTFVPVLIYPNPVAGNSHYVVINSGHTFKEADLKGTNALLYPRLGDWAVIKPTPTAKDPAAYEVVAAGLFDENWQFPKK